MPLETLGQLREPCTARMAAMQYLGFLEDFMTPYCATANPDT
jgi:hypothetical protein